MAKKDIRRFRSHFGGFNRKDVNDYIVESDRKHSEEIASLEAELALLKETLSEQENKLASLEEMLADATREKEKALCDADEWKKKSDDLETQLSDVSEKFAALPKFPTIDRVKNKLNDLSAEAGHTSEDIIASAKLTAQRILATAEQECEAKRIDCESSLKKIQSETTEQANYIRERLSKTAGMVLENVGSDLNESIESCRREINNCVNSMEGEIKTLLAKIDSRSEEMNERILYYKNYLADGIGEKLSQITQRDDSHEKADN